MVSIGETLAHLIDTLAAEFHASDRVLVEAAVRVAHRAVRDQRSWMHVVETAARARLQLIAIAV